MPSERSQTQNTTSHMIPFMWKVRKGQAYRNGQELSVPGTGSGMGIHHAWHE